MFTLRIIIFVISIVLCKCDYKEMAEGMEEIKQMQDEQLTRGPIFPKTNLSKLSILDMLETSRLPGTIISAYAGSVARLPCAGRPALDREILWLYSESVQNLTFKTIEDRITTVEDGELTIYYVRQSDAGAYQCLVDSSVRGLVVLEVLDDEDKYNVVKPQTSHGPYSSPARPITSELMVFNSWSMWSGCSRCGAVGRRRRYGICYVGYGGVNQYMLSQKNVHFAAEEDALLEGDDIKLFQAFPGGIPCRSSLLPKTIKGLPATSSRRNEIMIGLCKVPCKSEIFEVRSKAGDVIELANNSDGVYSLSQREPTQPPPVARDIIFAAIGTRVVIRCPGTTLRDFPVIWKVGEVEVTPRDMAKTSDGREHLNARDHIVFVTVQYYDSNVYSCWQQHNLAGVIKLKVFEDVRSKYGRRFTLFGLFACLCITWILTEKIHCYPLRRRMSTSPSPVCAVKVFPESATIELPMCRHRCRHKRCICKHY